jgi:hypothetical protein
MLHQEFSFESLSESQEQQLHLQVENTKLYKKSTSEPLGGLDCSTSIKHDQLVALNDARIGTLSLYNGLDVSITKNVFHWNNVDLQHFLNGEEVVCGVGTISPRFVLGDYVYWWRGCLGGAGISQPGDAQYEETIRCVQAEDVIQRYFGMQ